MPFYCHGDKTTEIKRKDKRIIRAVFAPIKNKRAYLPASATVEAALVIPLYLYAVLAVAYVIEMVGIKSGMEQAMYDSVRQIARYAYALELSGKECSEAEYTALAKGFMLKNLPDGYAQNSRIRGGVYSVRIRVTESGTNSHKLCMKAEYSLKNPFDIFGFGTVKICQQCVTAAWLGEAAVSDLEDENAAGTYVYITAQGTVYHRNKNCSYLKPSIRQVSQNELIALRNSAGAKYYPCEKCGRKQSLNTFFITIYGDRYHTDKNCSGLKRSIYKVPLSEVQDKKACSKCGN